MAKHDGCKDVYEQCKHYKVSKYCNRFLWLSAFFTLIVIVVIVVMQRDFRESQQKIIEIHKEHITRIDTCFTGIYDNLKNEVVNCDSLILVLERDKDLAKKITNYNSVKNLIVGLANNMSYRAMADELKKDSLLIHRQLADAQHATNELLELHFNRIQHEYTVLALWAGVLMIVFLIFSFYSLYKTDDIAKQGKDSLKEIKEKGDDVLKGLQKLQDDLTKEVGDKIALLNKWVETAQNDMGTLTSQFKGKLDSLELMAKGLEQLFLMQEHKQSSSKKTTKKTKEEK